MKAGPVSMSMETDVTCQNCGHTCTVTAWVLLSSVDEPDLVQQLTRGSLGTPCANCAQLVEADLPILVHRPEQGGTSVLAFAPASFAVASYEQSSEMAESLTAILFSKLGLNGAGVEVLLTIVPRLALRNLLVRDLRTDVKVPPEQLDLPADIAESYRRVLARLRQRMGYA